MKRKEKCKIALKDGELVFFYDAFSTKVEDGGRLRG